MKMPDPSTAVSEPQETQPRAERANPDAQPPRIVLAAAPGTHTDTESALAGAYSVVRAPDAAEARGLARDADLVIADAALPGADGHRLTAFLRSDASLAGVPIMLLTTPDSDVRAELEAGADDFLVRPYSEPELHARLTALLLREQEREGEHLELSVLSALPDAIVVADSDGAVVHLNEAFTELLGWRAEDGPFTPPYPWWPDGEAPPDHGEAPLRTRDGRTVWVWITTSTDELPATGGEARIAVMRDVSRERASRVRRAGAAELAGRFAKAHDLTAVLIAAVAGFTELFDGDSVVDVTTDADGSLFTASGPVPDVASLPEELRKIPDESAPNGEPLDGILLKPHGTDGLRAWVRFGTPRVVPEDEMIVGSLLADAMALAVDRVTTADELATRAHHLQQAVASHRSIGQAIGILVERHRLTPSQAFARLSKRSQDTNTKVRDLAARLVETGEEG